MSASTALPAVAVESAGSAAVTTPTSTAKTDAPNKRRNILERTVCSSSKREGRESGRSDRGRFTLALSQRKYGWREGGVSEERKSSNLLPTAPAICNWHDSVLCLGAAQSDTQPAGVSCRKCNPR